MPKSDKKMIEIVITGINKKVIDAWKFGVLGDEAMEAAISHSILMILQARQGTADMHTSPAGTIPVGFDICKTRIAVFEKLKSK